MIDWRLTTDNTALVVIDVQEKLMAAMPRRQEIIHGARKLIQSARILGIPTLLTLQYVKGLGPLCSEITEVATDLTGIEKLTFSCCGHETFTRAVKELRRPRIILCGVESHVCVQQTAIDLMGMDKFVYVCADATCSRRDLDHQTAMERLRDCGAVISTVESVVFEILREAGTDAFKQCLPLWK
jgi:nicotinamidase-related amidase